MSRDSSDDDIPGLASVSGSEGSDEESDEEYGFLSGTEDGDPSQGHVFNTRLWLMFETSILSQHVEVFRIYVLSPFLYGHAHQSDRWLKWCHQVGLLNSDIEFNLEALSDKELMAVEILLTAVSFIGKSMVGPHSDVAKLLQVMEKVEAQESPVLAARTARKWKWFIIMIDKIRESAEEIGITKDSFQSKRFFVEITCLFVMNQAVDHINKVLNGNKDYHTDFQKMRVVHEESGEQMKEEGEEFEKNGNYESAIDTYTTAMICCPYYQQLYISRAYAHMKLSKYRAAVADGMRAVYLNPGNSLAHICYIRALKTAGFKDRSAIAITDFNRKFPEEQNALLEQSFPDQAREKFEERKRDTIERKPTVKDIVLNDKIMGTCKQASEAYLAGNLDEAVFYYQEAVSTSEENEGWRACWVFSNCEQFLVSLYYAFGMALLSKGSSEDASKALSQFNFIITNHLFNFPAAHYGMGRALVLLHNHTEAGDHAKKGLELLASYRIIKLYWPGTTQYMTECMPHYIEPKLQQIVQQCEPKQVADAICRYPGCLQHHASSDIVFHQDYKGHVRMQCSDGCSIAYHPTCWRRFKSDNVLGADKDFLGTMCKTPDCEGEIRNVYIYDIKGGLKKVEGDPNVKKTIHTAPPSSAGLARESKRLSHWKKKSVGEVVESVPKGGGAQEEVFIGKVESVMVEEDSRREEAAVVTINRQAELDDEERDGNGGKSKVKKKLREMEKLEKMKLSSVQWNDLFSHPEREGLVQEEDSSIISKWEPDPAHPFLPPDHLREKIEEFEMKESPSIGLPSRLLGGGGTAVTPVSEDIPGPPSSEVIDDEDTGFFVSYFGEIVRAHGPLAPSDPQILESLNFLPEDRKVKIEKAGGIAKLLVDSGHFVMQGKLICPIEEVGVVAESMNANSASRSQSSEEGIGNDSEKQSDQDDAKSDNSITTPSPFAQKSALSGLLSSSHMKTDLQSLPYDSHSVVEDLHRSRGWVKVKSSKSKQQEVGPKRNTSALDPKMTNPAVQERKSMKSLSVNKKAEEVLRKAQIRRDKDLVFADEERRIGAKDIEDKRKSSMLSVGATGDRKNKDSSSSDEKRKASSGSSDEKGKKLDVGVARKKKSKLEDLPPEPNKNSNRNTSKESFNGLEKRHSQESNESPNSERRDLFSPTNSTSSVSSESSVPSQPATKKSSKNKKAKNNKPTQPGAATNAKSATAVPIATTTTTTKVQCQSAMVQTEPTLTKDKWVMTEAFVPVENFKERYEGVTREKKDLQEKLERSEDQRFKLQKTHKRELEQLLRQTKQEAKEAAQSRLSEMEGKLKSEGVKVESVRKESSEQLRLAKAEVKSLTDKIERMKKDITKKDSHYENKSRQFRTEIEQLHDDKQRYSDRLKASKEAETKAVVRATNAEVEVLNMRSDLVLKPWEVKIREIEAVCMTVPQGSELQRECMVYRDKMKSALEGYQVAVEDQMRQVKAGCDLSSMERIPSPVVHIPPQLGMMMMRPGFFPMMPMPRAPFGLGGMVRPQQMGGIPPMAPYQAQPEAPQPNHPPSTLPLAEAEPAPHAAASPSEVDMMSGGGGGKKSSFDRIVEKLGPIYPQYSKEDFKVFLREVRRSNKNTLSGLSLDTIAQQVKGIIEQREKKTGSRGGGGSAAKGKTSSGRSRQPAEKKGKQKSRLPPVATAPPPVTSSTDYDENSCIICYEDMREVDSSKLDCGHRFHSKCIRSWFREQSTCPTCRNHSLLVEEYPTLK